MKGERLSELRKDKGLTQDQLAKEIGISVESIGNHETDKHEADDDTKIAYANYFGTSVDYLLGLTDNPRPYSKNYLYLPASFNQSDCELLETMINYISKMRSK